MKIILVILMLLPTAVHAQEYTCERKAKLQYKPEVALFDDKATADVFAKEFNGEFIKTDNGKFAVLYRSAFVEENLFDGC